jgi:hypothetical protein
MTTITLEHLELAALAAGIELTLCAAEIGRRMREGGR